MTEYSPWPGTLISKVREETDEPCTKNTTGREGSPAFGAPSRLRYIHKGISPFLAQYSLLQISSPSAVAATAPGVGSASASPPATSPSPAPLMTARRASGRSRFVMIFSLSGRFLIRCSRSTIADADNALKRECVAVKAAGELDARICECHRIRHGAPAAAVGFSLYAVFDRKKSGSRSQGGNVVSNQLTDAEL